MADNTELNAGSGGDTISTDDLGTVKVQRVKIQYGTDGNATDVSDTNPLPIDDAGGSITVDGVISAAGAAQDDTAFTAGGVGGFIIMGANTSDSIDANDFGAVAMSTDRRLHVDAQIVGQDADVTIADGGNSITVDGTVTANLSATDNAVLDSIDTNTTGLNNTVGTDGTAGPASALSVAGTESGGTLQELRVDADGHLQIDVLSGGDGGTQYTEDDAAPANPVGTANALVRQDTPATLVSTDGDIVAQRATNYGAAYTQIVDSSGNFVDTFGGSGGTASTDDSAFTAGTGQGTPMMGFATADTVDSGDVGVVGMDTSRNLKVSIEVDNVGIGSGTQYTEGNTDATITGTALMMEDAADTLRAATGDTSNGLDVDVTRVQGTVTVDCNSSNVTVDNAAGASAVNIQDGGNSITVDGTVTADAGTGPWPVTDNGGSLTVDNSGTFAVQAAIDNAHSADYDTGAGTDTTTAFGIAVPASGGAAVIPGDATAGLKVDLGADNDVTVTGTVTANLSATDNAVLDQIEVNTSYGDNTGGGTETGALRVTIANNSTGVVSVDDNGGSLTIDGTVTANAGTGAFNNDSVATEGSALGSGVLIQGDDGTDRTNVLVDTDGHLQVDVLSGGGGGTQYTDDTDTHASGSTVGTAIIAAATPTDGSVNANDLGVVAMSTDRRLHVDSQIVGQDANVTVDGTVTANLSATDNAVLDQIEVNTSYGDNTGGGVEAGALRVTIANDSTGVVSVDDNGSTLSVDDGGSSLTVDGTVTANLSATDNAVLDQIEVNTSYGDNTGGGTETGALRVTIANNSTGVLSVDDNGATLSVDDGGGALTVDGTVSVNLNAGTNTNEVVGDGAHDAAAAGNPLLVAGVAQDNDDTAPPNRVSTEGDATRLATDFDGALHVRPHGPQIWDYHSNGSTALTDATVHAAPGAGLSIYVTDIVFSSGAATAINCFFEEGASTVLGPYYLEATAGRGMSVHFQTPKKITANTALTVTTSAAIAHSVDVMGYIAQG